MKEEKGLLLKEVEEKIATSQGFILMRYLGLKAPSTREFRNSLFEVSAEFEVLKKRIFFKALKVANLDLDLSDTVGHLGVVFSYEDPISAAKKILDFSKKHTDSLEFLGGRIDNALLTGKEVEVIAQLPSLQELRGMFVSVIAAPLSQTVGVLNSAISGVVSCIEQKTLKD